MSGRWSIETIVGTASDLHRLAPPASSGRAAWVVEVDQPTLVLGSSQQNAALEEMPDGPGGLAVARRRSGGGAVALIPGDHVWIDLWVPAGDRLWNDDVVEAAFWAGDAWAEALASATGLDYEVHRGPVISGSWSDQICFGGLGPGEVVLGGRKVVGLSQRRTRDWTRIQTMVHRRWDPYLIVDRMGLSEADRRLAAAQLRDVVGVVEDAPVIEPFLAALPA